MGGILINTIFRTRSKTWTEIQSNLLFVGLIELVIYNGGLDIKYWVQRRIDFFTPLVGPEYGIYYNANFWIIIPILLSLAFMALTCPGALRVFTEGSFTRKLKSLGTGFLLGFAFLGLATLLAVLTGTISFSYSRFEWQIIPILLPLFIQCAAEEILLRGYVPAVLGRKHSWDVVCFVSGALFIFHHIVNMAYFGFNTMFALDVFLLGVLLCLLVRWEGNFWIACGFHTAWNYTQTYLFATSNSGEPSNVGLFRGTVNASDGFYQEIYGYEGSIFVAALVGVAILWLIYRLRKEGKL